MDRGFHDFTTAGADEPVSFLIGLGLTVALLLVPIVLVGVILVAEWLILLLALPLATLVRIAFGAPWTVVVRSRSPYARYVDRAHGWGESRALIRSVAAEIARDGAPRTMERVSTH
jgi:predicted membrane chloride channel (bestrophin family)